MGDGRGTDGPSGTAVLPARGRTVEDGGTKATGDTALGTGDGWAGDSVWWTGEGSGMGIRGGRLSPDGVLCGVGPDPGRGVGVDGAPPEPRFDGYS